MRNGSHFGEMRDIWFNKNDDYDELCQAFVPMIRAMAENKAVPSFGADNDDQDEEWTRSVDGLMSKLLLFDQLSRPCFRGTDEAFKYGGAGLKVSRQLVTEFIINRKRGHEGTEKAEDEEKKLEEGSTKTLDGEFYPPYFVFIATALVHSEDLENHTLAAKVLEHSIRHFEDRPIAAYMLKYSLSFVSEHTEIVKRFGRYPHRNVSLGRASTAEEIAWLNDKDNLPAWATSQG